MNVSFCACAAQVSSYTTVLDRYKIVQSSKLTFTKYVGMDKDTPIECSAIGLLTLCLTETHTELRTQRADLLENNIHYIQNSTSPISFKFRSQIKIPYLVPFVPVGV